MIQRIVPDIEKILFAKKEHKILMTLNHVMKMIERNDSKESIFDFYYFITHYKHGLEVDNKHIIDEGLSYDNS